MTHTFAAYSTAACALALLTACPFHSGTPEHAPKPGDRAWPIYDQRCDGMQTSLPEMVVASDSFEIAAVQPAAQADFDREVPRILHQIDFGDTNDRAVGRTTLPDARTLTLTTHHLWAAWAAEHGWQHRIWTRHDEMALADMMPAENTQLVRDYLTMGDLEGAALIARYSILRAQGGVVVESEVPPPVVCLSEILTMRGLSCDTDWYVRNYGEPTSSVQLAGLMLSGPPGHRSFVHLEETVVGNDQSWRRTHNRVDHDFTVGKVFLNRSLGGVFQAVNAASLEELGMFTRRTPSPGVAKSGHQEQPGNTVAGLDPRRGGMYAPRPMMQVSQALATHAADGRSIGGISLDVADEDRRGDNAPFITAARGEISTTEAPIPPLVHQIWFGNHNTFAEEFSEASELWQRYSSQMNMTYRLWTEADDPQLAAWAGPVLWDLMLWYREDNDFRGASDVARYLILKHVGGAYFDLDLGPPRLWDDGPFVAMSQIFPMRGLIVASDNHQYDFGNSAIYPMNAVILSAPNHPVIDHMLKVIPDNHTTWQSGPRGHDPVLVTGPALLACSLAGSFNVASRGLWRRYFMTDAQQPPDGRFMSHQKRRTTR